MTTSHKLEDFLDQPGRSGGFGGIMDEYARATDELCRVVGAIEESTFAEARESDDPDTSSLRRICRHCINAAYAYSNYIRVARGQEADVSGQLDAEYPLTPSEFRPLMGRALRHTEAALEGLWDADGKALAALSFTVRWGPTYDPEMILEHGVVHILRHRRQIERWIAGS